MATKSEFLRQQVREFMLKYNSLVQEYGMAIGEGYTELDDLCVFDVMHGPIATLLRDEEDGSFVINGWGGDAVEG